MKRSVLILFLLAAVACAVAENPAPGPGAPAFAQGRTLFEVGQFEQAMARLEQAVALEPANSAYHHWLGRSYGRRAERTHWFHALGLARKTLREFRIAVELDPNNRSAWSDLMQYYQRAPGILGGSRKKAREIEARLATPPPASRP